MNGIQWTKRIVFFRKLHSLVVAFVKSLYKRYKKRRITQNRIIYCFEHSHKLYDRTEYVLTFSINTSFMFLVYISVCYCFHWNGNNNNTKQQYWHKVLMAEGKKQLFFFVKQQRIQKKRNKKLNEENTSRNWKIEWEIFSRKHNTRADIHTYREWQISTITAARIINCCNLMILRFISHQRTLNRIAGYSKSGYQCFYRLFAACKKLLENTFSGSNLSFCFFENIFPLLIYTIFKMGLKATKKYVAVYLPDWFWNGILIMNDETISTQSICTFYIWFI